MDSDFKEQIRADFAEVLANTEEFGRVCSWNGAPLLIAEKVSGGKQSYFAQGVNKNIKTIYCRDVDLPVPPTPTNHVKLDGVSWYVDDVQPSFGFWEIKLTRETA